MTRLFLLWASLIFSILFLLFPDFGMMGFPFSDMKLTTETYFYFLFEHIILVVLGLAVLEGATKYRPQIWMFIAIQVVDTFDYVLFYGNMWGALPFTWNQIKVVLYGMVLFVTWYNEVNKLAD